MAFALKHHPPYTFNGTRTVRNIDVEVRIRDVFGMLWECERLHLIDLGVYQPTKEKKMT